MMQTTLILWKGVKKERKWSLSCVLLFATPWTVDCQTPPPMGFSRQEYWSELPFPSPGDLPDPGIEPRSPTRQADSSPSEPPGSKACIKEQKILRQGILYLFVFWYEKNWIKPLFKNIYIMQKITILWGIFKPFLFEITYFNQNKTGYYLLLGKLALHCYPTWFP